MSLVYTCISLDSKHMGILSALLSMTRLYINRAEKMPLCSKSVKDICVKGGGGALYSLKKINRHKVGYATELL